MPVSRSQLEAILLAYLRGEHAPPLGGLPFPGRDGRMVTDFRKALDVVAQRAGWRRREVRSKAFQHSGAFSLFGRAPRHRFPPATSH